MVQNRRCITRTYTAPADGWVELSVCPNPAGTASFCQVYQDGLSVWNCNNGPSTVGADYFTALAPIRKGVFKAWYRNVALVGFRFIYAVGSEPTA